MKSQELLDDLIKRYPNLEVCKESIYQAFLLLANSFESGSKLLIAGNGGSAADSEHIVGELMKAFKLPRLLPENYKNKLINE